MKKIAILAAASGIMFSMAAGASQPSDRDGALLTPRPFPANRVEDVRRPETGRLWISRFPIGNRTPLGELRPGAAQYGAAADDHRWIHIRSGPTALPINPWRDHNALGLPAFEAARSQWLKENGYILQVRTHINARYGGAHEPRENRSMYGQALPEPRATIRIDDEMPRRPSRLRVDAGDAALPPVSSLPIRRIVMPDAAGATGPITVLPATPTPTTETAAAND